MAHSVQKKVLPNGLTILYKEVPSETVTVEFSVHTGSIMESSSEAGISHFLEHLLFEGTKKRPSSKAIANEIEKYGGEFNAATSHERTFYYVKIAKQHFSLALDILHDMFAHSLFDPKIIEKERKVILDEVNMINDNPRQYQWIFFNKALYGKHPASLPVYGNIPLLKKLSRAQILSYFHKWYVPSHITVVIVGDVSSVFSSVTQKFSSAKAQEIFVPVIPPIDYNKKTISRLKKKLGQSYVVLGYKTITRDHPDAIVFDVIGGILGRGQSGWLFDEVRAKRGLCYSIGFEYDGNKTFGSAAVYCGTDKKNIALVEKLIFEQLENVKTAAAFEVAEAKTYLAGSLALRYESTSAIADDIAYWHYAATLSGFEKYLTAVAAVTAADVHRVAKKWFRDQYTLAVLEQK
ncbi:insulinase family protein [Candidatus Woesearchaeota archaeon]|nr:insulinase family protein [Candidatus Woesearchaeota archaeon]